MSFPLYRGNWPFSRLSPLITRKTFLHYRDCFEHFARRRTRHFSSILDFRSADSRAGVPRRRSHCRIARHSRRGCLRRYLYYFERCCACGEQPPLRIRFLITVLWHIVLRNFQVTNICLTHGSTFNSRRRAKEKAAFR